MDMVIPQELLRLLKDKHLLLDSNVFIDSVNKSTIYSELFNNLKENDTTIITTEFVRIEWLKGASSEIKYKEKEAIIDKIVDTILPIHTNDTGNVYKLIKSYKEDGKSLSITDYFLGASLINYKHNLFLMTRNTTEFPSRIFKLEGIINIPIDRNIFTYGIYSCPSV